MATNGENVTNSSNDGSDRGTTWIDVFPWAGSINSQGAEFSWPLAVVEEADRTEQERIVGQAIDLVLTRFSGWTVGELFPAMPDLDFRVLDLPPRAFNAFSRNGMTTTSDLADKTVGDLLDIKNLGVGTLRSALQILALKSLTPLSGQTPLNAEPVNGIGQTITSTGGADSLWLDGFRNDAEVLANWYIRVGLPTASLFGEIPDSAPDEVRAAQARIAQITAREIASTPSIADLVEGALLQIDERSHEVLQSRLFADSPKTLDEIGRALGLTRERIRQLESRARVTLTTMIESDSATGHVANATRMEIHLVRPLDGLLTALPALDDVVHSIQQPVWRVLDRLDDSYEIEEGWCAAPSLEAAKSLTAEVVGDLANEFGVARITDLVNEPDFSHPEWMPQWLTYCGYVVLGEYIISRTKSVNDVAAALLSIEGAPLTLAEIQERLISPRSTGSISNALTGDNRFRRVDSKRWSLTAWGLREYTSIRDEITRVLAEHGGVVLLADLVDEITNKFGVAQSSVITYASANPFRVRDGVVMAGTSASQPSKPPEKTRGYYRRRGSWILSTVVTGDHLRGSGILAHSALRSIIGIQPGARIEVGSRLGPQGFSWVGPQPQISSIRRFLVDLDASLGDRIYFVFGDGGSFDVELAPSPPADKLAQALWLSGGEPSLCGEAALAALGESIAVGVRRYDTLETAFRSRGDVEIADLLRDVRLGS